MNGISHLCPMNGSLGGPAPPIGGSDNSLVKKIDGSPQIVTHAASDTLSDRVILLVLFELLHCRLLLIFRVVATATTTTEGLDNLLTDERRPM